MKIETPVLACVKEIEILLKLLQGRPTLQRNIQEQCNKIKTLFREHSDAK